MNFSDCGYDIVDVPLAELRIDRHAREAAEYIDRARTACGSVLNLPAARRSERRPRRMQSALVFDMRLRG